jgi:MFS family permease
LNVSLESVSLTITSYLVIQGIAPVIWGSLADTVGRRPVYIASFSVYIIANIALSISPNFIVLLVFRGLQAAGSASTVSIGNGVIQDISPPAKRGAFIAFYQASAYHAPSPDLFARPALASSLCSSPQNEPNRLQ